MLDKKLHSKLQEFTAIFGELSPFIIFFSSDDTPMFCLHNNKGTRGGSSWPWFYWRLRHRHCWTPIGPKRGCVIVWSDAIHTQPYKLKRTRYVAKEASIAIICLKGVVSRTLIPISDHNKSNQLFTGKKRLSWENKVGILRKVQTVSINIFIVFYSLSGLCAVCY